MSSRRVRHEQHGETAVPRSTPSDDIAVERPFFDPGFVVFWVTTTLLALAQATDGTAAALADRAARRGRDRPAPKRARRAKRGRS
jgi:hypothetical protein